MKNTLLIFLLSLGSLMGQNTLELNLNSTDFNKKEIQVFESQIFNWNQGAYDFLGPSAFSFHFQDIDLQIRFKVAGHWQEWQAMDDQHNASEISDRQTWVLAPFNQIIEAWQLRSQSKVEGQITIRFFWTPLESSGNTIERQDHQNDSVNPEPKSKSKNALQACNCPKPPICDRSCWCPNNDCDPLVVPTPTVPTHLIVHHSAGSNTSSNFGAVVAYYWDLHVNTNGWDDIGYNWLIDPNGVVYEGRGSGNMGAHFSCLNSGTLGFCLIGNYQNSPVPAAGLQALGEILLYEACANNIDPSDSSLHQSSQLNLRHISGHRDANSATVGCPNGTACPGQLMYNKLDSLALALSQNTCLLHQDEQSLPSAHFYPNPTEATLSWDVELESIKLIDPQGRAIHLPMSKQKTLDLSDLAPGIYSIHYQWKEQWHQQKIYIQ